LFTFHTLIVNLFAVMRIRPDIPPLGSEMDLDITEIIQSRSLVNIDPI
jgi:hypothetical protein